MRICEGKINIRVKNSVPILFGFAFCLENQLEIKAIRAAI